jgi:4-amino-4-deoxy-L-arabinose transferase-like glycosyltransferase
VGEIAWRVHLCSAFFAALATWLTYRVGLRLTGHVAGALLGALSLAASRLLWSQAVIAEVYALNLFLTMLSFELVLRWRDDRRDRWLYALALVTGLSLGNHHIAVGIAVVAAAWILVTDWRRILAARVLLAGALLFALGLSVYAYIPIRAAARPPIHGGAPDSLEETLAHVGRDRYQDEGYASGGPTDVARHVARAWGGTGTAFGLPLMLLAGFGAVRLLRQHRGPGLATLGLFVMNTVVLNALLRSVSDPTILYTHRVYYIPAHAMVALWIAVGCAGLLTASRNRSPMLSRALTAGVLAVVAATAAWNAPHAQRQGDQRARNFGLDVLDSMPPGAGISALGDVVAFPLAYLKFVEGERPDVQLLSPDFEGHGDEISLLVTPWPLTDFWRASDPRLEGYASIPHGLVYLVAEASVAREATYASFQSLPGPPRGPQDGWPADPFDDVVRSMYASYHARLGAKFLARGMRAAAESQFERAEELNPGSAYVTWVLVEIYRHFGIHRADWVPMLERALAEYDEEVPAARARFYPVRREEIQRALADVKELPS